MRSMAIILWLLPGAVALQGQVTAPGLPDAPGVQMFAPPPTTPVLTSVNLYAPPCLPKVPLAPESAAAVPPSSAPGAIIVGSPAQAPPAAQPCPPPSPYSRFVNNQAITPMTVRQKGMLAAYDVINPINLLTIGFTSAFSVGFNAHSAYGPGLRGWARNSGYSLLQDAQGEAIETFAIASLTHEDPRYHRLPKASTLRRLGHAIAHTYVSRHDDGHPMPNYENLVGFPICAELSNLYVPGIATNSSSTVKRVLIGLAANPADDIVTEFLPDVGSRLYLRVVFVQQVLNNIAAGQSAR
jgi:hypothetical protein